MKALNKRTGQLEKVYVKALDSMPVGTVVEFNGQASDIPSGWEEVSKSIITAGINSSLSINNDGNNHTITLVQKNKIGDLLTIDNGSIKIGTGVSRIKFNAACQYIGYTGGYFVLEIARVRNGASTRIGLAVGTVNAENTITSCINFVDVQEGDLINLNYISNASNSNISADSTLLYVEVID